MRPPAAMAFGGAPRVRSLAWLDLDSRQPLGDPNPLGCNRIWQEDETGRPQRESHHVCINPGVANPADFGDAGDDVAGFTDLAATNSWPLALNTTQTWQFERHVSYLTGKHTIRFGARIPPRNRYECPGPRFERRHFLPDPGGLHRRRQHGHHRNARPQRNTVWTPDRFRLIGTTLRHVSQDGFGAFIQDDWHVVPRLMINAGLRYDLSTVIKESNDLLGNFDPNLGFVQVGQADFFPV